MLRTLAAKVLASALLIRGGIAGYVLTDDYSRDTFFGNFTAFKDKDPTNGFVKYVDYKAAQMHRLIGSTTNFGDASYLGVDYATISSTARKSVRIASNKRFNHGLFIIDLSHMPASSCGSWPAFWLLGPDPWPQNGEVDIIEGVHMQEKNQMTLHTSSGCSINKSGFSGTVGTTDCGNSEANQGCGIFSKNGNSFGTGFNAIGGGVYATEWTSEAISIWFWPRNRIPSDVVHSANPRPDTWGTPVAKYAGACTIDRHFRDMQIIFDTTFCGDWAGKNWAESGCAKDTGTATCEEYVGRNPATFKESYWLVNAVKVYAEQGSRKKSRVKRRGLPPQAEESMDDGTLN
ncbi:MAG: hypothetical protein Q9163_000108 [Psora crenata]